MTDIEIRYARSEDIQVLNALAYRSKSSWGYSGSFMDIWREALQVSLDAIESKLVILAENASGEPLGFLSLEYGPLPATSEPIRVSQGWMISMCFIDPNHFHKGIGRTLTRSIIHMNIVSQFEPIFIEADPFAEPFYRRVGANKIGEVPSTLIPDRHLPLLILDPKKKWWDGA